MHVAYISGQAYAGGVANEVRATNMVEAIGEAGHRVSFLQHDDYLSSGWKRVLSRLGGFGSGLRLRVVGLGSAVPEWLSEQAAVDVVWLYGTDIRFVRRVGRWCRRNRVPLICEVVDWYRWHDALGPAGRLFALMNGAPSMRYIARRSSGVVVASRLLEAYFGSRGVMTARVPAVMKDLTASQDLSAGNDQGVLRLVYAGSANARDAAVVENLERLCELKTVFAVPVRIDIIGWSAPRECSTPSVRLVHHGRLSREQTLKIVGSGSFTVLQRPESAWYARAGFPSKVAESLVLGVPVISNRSSDLAEYLNVQNSVMLAAASYDALLEGVEQAAELCAQGKLPLRRRVASDALSSFGVSAAASRIVPLLETVVSGKPARTPPARHMFDE